MSASLTVYTYSSETPLKQVDINLPCSIGTVRITAQAEMDEEGNIISDSLRITDLQTSELLSDTGEVIELPRLCNKDYNEAVFWPLNWLPSMVWKPYLSNICNR